MAKRNRQGNPVLNAHDLLIREMLSDEHTPDADRDSVLAEQLLLLREAKTRADPHWQEAREPHVETQCIKDVLCLDGLVRMNRRA
jgi:hypothetical protein